MTDLKLGGSGIYNGQYKEYGNRIKEIDVSNNTLLSSLYLANNQLTDIDVSNNTELEYLWLNGNKLTKVDVNGNKLLVSLYLSDNQLEDLNLSNNLKIERLHVGGNKFDSLDLEYLENLKYLDSGIYGNVPLNTNISEYAIEIKQTVYNSDLKIIISGKIGTGYKIKTSNINYLTVVYGDTTNDGELKINDVTKAYQYLKCKTEMKEYDMVAANVSRDITIADIAKMYQYLKGKLMVGKKESVFGLF